ncbi:nucleoplasmin-like [Corapipo altera]|uniref:nucleoplasmin-like n=1 Tax=Corapipo altera TaxID=415028 RepID=UPI000FD68B6D|nr:nucleoplasmin-like [Corapipo altera]
MDTLLPFSRLLPEERPVAELWGCQLGMGAQSCVVKEGNDFLEHLVLLRMIGLGVDARDKLHVVAVDSKNASEERRPLPIATLWSSVLPMISPKALELVPPFTVVLQCGAGPVYLNRQCITLEDDASSEAKEEEF